MINLKRYLLVPFDDEKISNGELKLFSQDHLGRMQGLNDSGPLAGQLAGIIAATQGAYDVFAGSLDSRDAAGSGRVQDTVAMNAALDAFLVKVRQREGRVKDKFGKAGAEYAGFFPQGLTEYNEATLENVESLMARMVTRSTENVAQVGQDMVDEFTALRSAFLQARGDQTVQSGDVGEAILGREGARLALADQLTDNLFFFGKLWRREPEKLASVMNQSLLREDEAAEEPPALPVPPGP